VRPLRLSPGEPLLQTQNTQFQRWVPHAKTTSSPAAGLAHPRETTSSGRRFLARPPRPRPPPLLRPPPPPPPDVRPRHARPTPRGRPDGSPRMRAPRGRRLRLHHRALVLLLGGITRRSAPSRSCVASTSSCPQVSSASTTACCSSGRPTSAPLSAAASSSARRRLPRGGRASGGGGGGETEGERRPLAPGASGGWRPRVGWSSLLRDALKRENMELWGGAGVLRLFCGMLWGCRWMMNNAHLMCKIYS
jgi:hypothetical protein